MKPGFYGREAASRISRTIAELGETPPGGEPNPGDLYDIYAELIPAKITAVTLTSGINYYSWTEQIQTVTGWADKSPGLSGTATFSPALEKNNVAFSTFPFYADLKVKYDDANLGPVFEFVRDDAGGGGGGITSIVGQDGVDPITVGTTTTIGLANITPDRVVSGSGGAGTIINSTERAANPGRVESSGLGAFTNFVRTGATVGGEDVRLEMGTVSAFSGRSKGYYNIVVGSDIVELYFAEDTSTSEIHWNTEGLSSSGAAGIGKAIAAKMFGVNNSGGWPSWGVTGTGYRTVDVKGGIVVGGSTSGGSGTVTSVGVSSANAALSVSGSPITTSGTITLTANTFNSSSPGVVPSSGGGTSNFLRADGTWAAPSGGSGTVTSVGVSSANTALSISGSPITTSGTITITANTFSSFTSGIVPASSGVMGHVLKADGTWGFAQVEDGDKGDLTVSTFGATWTIDNNVVGNTKLAQMNANTVKCNPTAATANASDFAIPVNSVLGRVAGNLVAAAVVTNQIGNSQVTNPKLANMNANTFKGNNTGAAAAPLDLTVAQMQTALAIPAAASVAEQQAATAINVYTTPGRQREHPSALKFWVKFSVAAGVVTVRSSNNVSGVVRNAVGDFTITHTAVTDAHAVISGTGAAVAGLQVPLVSAQTTTTVRVLTYNFAPALTDPIDCFISGAR